MCYPPPPRDLAPTTKLHQKSSRDLFFTWLYKVYFEITTKYAAYRSLLSISKCANKGTDKNQEKKNKKRKIKPGLRHQADSSLVTKSAVLRASLIKTPTKINMDFFAFYYRSYL